MNIAVYDDDNYKIYEGSAAIFLKDNDGDEEVSNAIDQCKDKGIAYFCGGASPEFMIVRVAKG